MKIGFSPPDISKEDIKLVVEALESGWITTGPKTKLLEKKLSEYYKTNKSVCLNSATAGLFISLRLLGIKEGDEVITTAYTYSATASVIAHTGAEIVLCDTLEDSFFIDYKKVSSLINERTKAIIAVDIGGVLADYKKLYEVVEDKKHIFKASSELQKHLSRVSIIADAAHSIGAIDNGNYSGSLADFSVFSFHAVKNLTTAEGGALTWNIKGYDDELLYKEAMLNALHAQTKDALSKSNAKNWEYDIMFFGYKFNMTDIAAAIGISQLNDYENKLKRREEIVKIYDEQLLFDGLKALNHFEKNKRSSYHLYLLRLIGKEEEYRNEFISRLADHGVSTNVHYKPLPMLSAYKNIGYDIKDFPNAYNMYKNEISIPLYSTLKDTEIEYIINKFKLVKSQMR